MNFADTLQKASRFAAEAHYGQIVPGTTCPYFLHVAQVANELFVAYSQDPELDIGLAIPCAYLHDVIEDTCIGADTIENLFGKAVAEGVQALTKDRNLKGLDRIEENLARILKAPKAVWAVKLADRVTNLQKPPSSWGSQKISAYISEAALIHERLHAASPWLAGRLIDCLAHYPG